jgi:hypothetical protein
VADDHPALVAIHVFQQQLAPLWQPGHGKAPWFIQRRANRHSAEGPGQLPPRRARVEVSRKGDGDVSGAQAFLEERPGGVSAAFPVCVATEGVAVKEGLVKAGNGPVEGLAIIDAAFRRRVA